MKIVISLGGSVLTKELTSRHFKKYIKVMKYLAKKNRLIIVIGGGKVCREYQRVGKGLGADRDAMDFIGVMSTHLNAATLASGFGNEGHLIPWKPLNSVVNDVKNNFGKKILVCGGYDTGSSTDLDAAYFAKLVNADLLINASNVDGVYSDDPKRNPDAKKFNKITYDNFLKIIKRNAQTPGEYRLFDLKAAQTIKKFKIRTIIINGSNPDEIIKAVNGQHNGTVVETPQ